MLNMQMGPHAMMSLDSKEQGYIMQAGNLEAKEQEASKLRLASWDLGSCRFLGMGVGHSGQSSDFVSKCTSISYVVEF